MSAEASLSGCLRSASFLHRVHKITQKMKWQQPKWKVSQSHCNASRLGSLLRFQLKWSQHIQQECMPPQLPSWHRSHPKDLQSGNLVLSVHIYHSLCHQPASQRWRSSWQSSPPISHSLTPIPLSGRDGDLGNHLIGINMNKHSKGKK